MSVLLRQVAGGGAVRPLLVEGWGDDRRRRTLGGERSTSEAGADDDWPSAVGGSESPTSPAGRERQ
jgi:hypothetical protein